MPLPNTTNRLNFRKPQLDSGETQTRPPEVPQARQSKSADSSSRAGKPNRRAGTPRGRVTEKDASVLAFLGRFPAANAETLSMLSYREGSPLAAGGELPSVKGTAAKLRKLEGLGAVEKHRHAVTGELIYGLTPLGFSYATDLGHELDGWTQLQGLSLERLNHYRMIARVAALLVSPVGYYSDTLGEKVCSAEELVTEKQMRLDFDPVKKMLDAARKQGKSGDFGRWREQNLRDGLEKVKAGKLRWDSLLEAHPTLLTLGQPQRETSNAKPIHQPDLAVLPAGRTTPKAANLLVEVELTKKSWPAYDAILATLAAEFQKPYVYSRAVYFTTHGGVEALLRRVDAAGEYELFASGKLLVLPILDRDGNAVRAARRVVIGG